MRVVKFYKVRERFGRFSNFAAYPVELDGKVGPTSGHHFQAQRFVGTEFGEEMRRARSPMIAARMGHDRNRALRADWQRVEDEVMRRAVLAKFTRHAEPRDTPPRGGRREAGRAHARRL